MFNIFVLKYHYMTDYLVNHYIAKDQQCRVYDRCYMLQMISKTSSRNFRLVYMYMYIRLVMLNQRYIYIVNSIQYIFFGFVLGVDVGNGADCFLILLACGVGLTITKSQVEFNSCFIESLHNRT